MFFFFNRILNYGNVEGLCLSSLLPSLRVGLLMDRRVPTRTSKRNGKYFHRKCRQCCPLIFLFSFLFTRNVRSSGRHLRRRWKWWGAGAWAWSCESREGGGAVIDNSNRRKTLAWKWVPMTIIVEKGMRMRRRWNQMGGRRWWGGRKRLMETNETLTKEIK